MALGGTTYGDLWGDDWRAELGLPVVQSEAIPEDKIAAVSFDPETGEVIDAAVIENVAPPPVRPPYAKPRGNSNASLCCYCGHVGAREVDEVPGCWKLDLTGRLWCVVCQKTPAFRAATRKPRRR